MKRFRIAALLVLASVIAFAIAGCGSPAAKAPSTSKGPAEATAGASTPRIPVKVSKDTIFLNPTESYDPATFPKTAMTGAPSNIPFFKPVHDEGIVNRDYPAYDAKTFKFLDLMNQCLAPQWFYIFHKNGGTLNKDVTSTGYKFADILDSGHIKVMPNLMLGYYDFAWLPGNLLTELWSGNESQYPELWRGGSDYVIIGASYDGGTDLMAPPSVTSLSQLAGKTVGIMNPSFHTEALLNKTLKTAGLATESAGGTVKIEMGTPGVVMNDLIAKKLSAATVWGKYMADAKSKFGFKTLVKWQDMGYGSKVPSIFLVVRKDIIQNHPDIVQAVVQANYDATKQAVNVGDYQGPNDSVYGAYWLKSYGVKPNIVSPPRPLIDAQANSAYLHEVIDYMTQCGYFKTPYTYSDLVNETFYNKVKK